MLGAILAHPQQHPHPGCSMRGTVIHCNGRVWRSLEGQSQRKRLSVIAVSATASFSTPGEGPRRPVLFSFRDGERQIGGSTRVLLKRGRRYPGVEHWFVLPDEGHRAGADAAEVAQPEYA